MNRFLSNFFLLITAVLTLMPPLPVSAQSLPLEWNPVELPGKAGFVIASPSEVSDIAIGSGTFYALDSANSRLYRSRNGGATWIDATFNLVSAGAAPPFTMITIAPDRPGTLGVVTNGGTKVFVTTDGAGRFVNTFAPITPGGPAIQALAISPGYESGKWEIAIGTAVWGDGLTSGNVWSASGLVASHGPPAQTVSSLSWMRSRSTPPKTIAPSRPFPTGRPSTHLSAGCRNQSVSAPLGAGASPVSATRETAGSAGGLGLRVWASAKPAIRKTRTHTSAIRITVPTPPRK